MRPLETNLDRRRFLCSAAVSAVSAMSGPVSRTSGMTWGLPPRRKTILSFYCDDTGPYTAGARAFQTFLDYCAEERIAGESSLILGANRRSMTRDPNQEESAYLDQVRRAWD
ncbi:MAG: hypothetical protein ACP5XB_05595 [Isosphaeraceae bacterium]